MKARLIRIGNPRGLRLPKPAIEEAGLEEQVELQVRGAAGVISSRHRLRKGWAKAAVPMSELGADRLLDKPTPTRFDEKEWRWR